MSGEKIIPINIEEEMKTAYIDYSMSVIVSRALPDVRDGLKPVHRRVLYGMLDLGVLHNRPYKKSARIVGEVLGKYHPHGDTSVYDTMVRMAQDWSLRYMLVDGQGNYGSIDGDPPAAMRYTEARLRKITEEMLNDIEKDTVDFRPNFDDSLTEPTVLPSRIPNLLMNGASGIAVGMATNMAPHNLTEVINGILAYIDDNNIDIDGLMKHIKAPDFPTGGTIYGYEGVKDAFRTGRGRVMMRAKASIEPVNNRERIIVTEIPFQINKAEMIKRQWELCNEKKIEGITEIRDESNREGMRIVYELRSDAISNVVLNNLYKYSALQTSFSINNVVLVKGRPEMLNLKDMIFHFVEHRHDVIVRRTKFDLMQAEKRAHILEGLLIAQKNIEEVIKIIRESESPDAAKDELITRFSLSEIQARAILDMRLRTLTGLEVDKLNAEYDELMKSIAYFKEILGNEELRYKIIREELVEIKEKYGDERRTDIVYAGDDLKIEDMIADEDVVITISHLGYMKRTNLAEYRSQNRGGRGSKGTATRDEDFVEHMFIASTHNYILLFSEKGQCYWIRAYEVPEGAKNSKGRAIQNLISIAPDDKVKAFINIKNLQDEEYIQNNYIILCTKDGIIKKTSVEAYSRPRANGINAITIREGDVLLEAALTNGNNEIMIATKLGKVCRFPEAKVRPMGRNASGVIGIDLNDEEGGNNEVIGMICIDDMQANVLVVSEKGYGKRSDIEEYRITNRGGKGVKTINITEKTGNLVGIKSVTDANDLMIITKNGIAIRMNVSDLRVMGRATQGVRLINIQDNDSIAAVTKVDHEDETETEVAAEGTTPEAPTGEISSPEAPESENTTPTDDNV
ncbi:MAG: DNA gyrase subunit A [Sphingobacteriaceae bacterium]|nr:DNA gyrase subunit A [Sphingobacteriaceae bacterium]